MPFLLRPAPISGESLSSWRQRSGRENGFLWYPTASGSPTGDPDRLPSSRETTWLEQQFIKTEAVLATLCLNRFLNQSIGEPVGGQLIRWVINHGHTGKTDGVGNGFCPECLATDEVPHFRLSWRLAFMTHCPVHECQLINSCPSCHRRCWPETYANRHKFNARWLDLRHCPECGTDLSKAAVVFDGKHEVSSNLWKLLANDDGSQFSTSAMPMADYFRALWSTCRLLGRQIKRLSGKKDLEELQAVLPVYKTGRTLEKQTGQVRQALLSMAIWLLDDWPSRFVATCKAADITRADFGATDNCSPPWFDEVVRDHLNGNVNWITREDVKSAIGQLKTQGHQISKNALRRKLGVSESWAINEILDQRRKGSINELACLCQHYRLLVAHTPPSRDQQRTLCRDFLILLITTFSGEKVESVCKMNQQAIDAVISAARNDSESEAEQLSVPLSCLIELDDQYRNGIRPEFRFRHSEPIDIWFLSRFGKRMDGHSVRARFALIMKELLDPKLWNSIDVFRGTATGI